MSAPRRKFGFWLATALVIGNIMGAGIFMMPAGLVPYGWNALSAWVLTLVGVLCLAWVFAELARHLPNAGGTFGFMTLAAGEPIAFLGAWGYLVSCWAANAAITVTGVSYFTRLVPSVGSSSYGAPVVALTVIWLLTWVNLRGIQAAGAVQLITTIVKLIPFVAVVLLAVWRVFEGGWSVFPPIHVDSFSLAGTTSAAGLTLFAMLGLESATIPADAVENSARNVPRATMVGTGVTALLSLVATCAVVLMLPPAQVLASKAPIADFIAVSWGEVAGGLVAVCAVASSFGALNGWLLLGGELPAAMADAGTLPQWFGRRNAAGAAAGSILVGSIFTTALAMMGYTRSASAAFSFAALLAAATGLGVYVICSFGVFKLMRTGQLPRRRGLVICAGGASIFSLWTLYGSGWEALGWGTVLTAAGWPLFLAARSARRATAHVPAA